MVHVEDGMCKNLFALVKHDNLSIAAAALRVIFLTFEAQRKILKFQLEEFLNRVIELDLPSYEHKECALDTVLQLCRIPGFLTDV
jgi:brefeldin A-resistance guanine nucleotide exchange factor 1